MYVHTQSYNCVTNFCSSIIMEVICVMIDDFVLQVLTKILILDTLKENI